MFTVTHKSMNTHSQLTAFQAPLSSASEHNITHQNEVAGRIEAIVVKYGLSYFELAKEMGVTRTTVHDIRKGNRPATRKFILKLELAEKRLQASQLAALGEPNESMIVFAANSQYPPAELFVAPDEIWVQAKATTTDPNPATFTVKLTPPPLIQGMQAIVSAHTKNKYNELLAACLPKEFASKEKIEQMSSTSYLWALKKIIVLILGANWKDELTQLLAKAEPPRPITGEQKTESTSPSS